MEHADEKIQCFFVSHVVYQNDSPTNAATSTALFGLGFDLRFFIWKIMYIVFLNMATTLISDEICGNIPVKFAEISCKF